MARADSKLPRLAHSSASAIHVRLRSSSSTPTPMVARTMAAQVALAGGSDFSAASASLSHASRLITTPLSAKLFTPRAMILDTIASLPCASSSCGVLARVLFASFLFSPRRGGAAHAAAAAGGCRRGLGARLGGSHPDGRLGRDRLPGRVEHAPARAGGNERG